MMDGEQPRTLYQIDAQWALQYYVFDRAQQHQHTSALEKMLCPILFESILSFQKHLKMGMHWALLLHLQGLLTGVQDLDLYCPFDRGKTNFKSVFVPKQYQSKQTAIVFQHNITHV